MPYPDLRKGETYEEYLARRREQNRLYKERHLEQVRQWNAAAAKRYRENHPTAYAAARAKYGGLHVDEIRIAERERSRKYREANPERVRLARYKTRVKLRKEVLAHYGGACACCGETTHEFLALDHINGGGRQHRAALGNGGVRFLYWLRRNNYPDDIQVLCHNCNAAKAFHGTCPHQAPTS